MEIPLSFSRPGLCNISNKESSEDESSTLLSFGGVVAEYEYFDGGDDFADCFVESNSLSI